MLHEHAIRRKEEDTRFLAIIHGADPGKLTDEEIPKTETLKNNLLFGDPKDYANMNETDKKELTEKMMNKFGSWAKVKRNG